MGSMLRRTTLREIRQTFGRFAAILAIIALGVGFFSGVRVTTPAMVNMMDDYLQEQQFYDFRLLSTLGWEAEDIAALAQQEGVRYAEGSISMDVIFTRGQDGDVVVLKTHTLPEHINGISLRAGRMPQTSNECIADADSGFALGDVCIRSPENDADTCDALPQTEYTVVGLADSSYYINFERGTTALANGSVAGFLYLPRDAFDLDYVTEIFVRFEQDFTLYSDAYADCIAAKTDAWEALTQAQADARFQRIYDAAAQEIADGREALAAERADGQRQLDDAKQTLDDAAQAFTDAKAELDAAANQIAQGQSDLASNRAELQSGQRALRTAKQQLDATNAQLDAAAAQLAEGETQWEAGQAQLDAAYAELAAGEAELQAQQDTLTAQKTAFETQYAEQLPMLAALPPALRAQLEAALAEFEAGQQALDAAFAELEAGRSELEAQQAILTGTRTTLDQSAAELEAGRAQYEHGLRAYQAMQTTLQQGQRDLDTAAEKLASAEAEYARGQTEYEAGLASYTEGRSEWEENQRDFERQIAEAETELNDAQAELDALESPETYLLDRNTNIGYACFENDSEIVAQVAKVFPVFFILVAALVCMTTMRRMVEEQRTQIGVLAALGYSEGAILGKFLFYAGSAALLGCILGFGIGTYLFPAIIWVTYKLMYLPLTMPYLFDWKLACAALVVSLLCSMGTTWISCRQELRQTAANLMRPKAPKAGGRVLLERIPLLWNRLSFLQKVSVRNIFRYRGRLFMMIAGIGGCMALLVTGFGIKDSIAGFAQTQYDEIQIADAELHFASEDTEAIRALLAEKSAGYMLHNSTAMDLCYGGRVKSVTVQTIEDFSQIGAFMQFRTVDGEPLPAPETGAALISHSLARRYGAKLGEEILLRDAEMHELRLTVAGIFENHVYNYVFLSAETYAALRGEAPAMNSAYLNLPAEADAGSAAAAIASEACVTQMTRFSETATRMRNMMASLDYIVLLVILSAAGLAFIVIYNLTNINITERTREIATIKVLGFFRRETSAYVLRENLTLTSMGVLLGAGLGVLLHRFVMAQIVIDLIDFNTRILPMSFVYSVLLTFLFNAIVNLVMERKLERIDMAQSLKSVD